MSKSAKTSIVIDPVDWFAAEILRNPDRADALKESLRSQIGLGSRSDRHFADDADPSDPIDLWDNVPV